MHYTTDSAPWNPDGALPPGLTESHVRQAYATDRIKPSRILALLQKKADLTAARRVRALLDDPSHRRELERLYGQGTIASLPLMLYRWLHYESGAQPVYRRLIEPAEVRAADGARSLVLPTFQERLKAEKAQRGAPVDKIAPQSQDEYLAIYVLAYGLYQPEIGQALVEALLTLGQGYVEFFGARPALAQAGADRAQARPASQVTGADEVVAPARNAARAEPPPAPAVPPPQAASPGAEPKVEVALPRIGPRQSSLAEVAGRLACARDKRMAVGGAPQVRRTDLDAALGAEEALHSELERAEAAVLAEARQLAGRLEAALDASRLEYSCAAPGGSADATARWLDLQAPELEDYIARAEDLVARQRELELLDPRYRVEFQPAVAADAAELLQVLGERSTAVQDAVAAALGWRDTKARLQAHFEGCSSPHPLPALAAASVEDMAALLRRAVRDERLAGLAPLLVRWISEHGGWSARAELLEESLGSTAADPDQRDALLSFLTVPQLQDLLRLGNERLDRHVVLFAFGQGLAAGSSLFFDFIWSFTGWSGRTASVGEDVARVFDALRKLVGVRGGAHHALDILLSAPSQEGEERNPEGLRSVASADLVKQLLAPTGMTGHYFELRRLARERFLLPLKPLIQARKRREVQEEVARLEARLTGDELLDEVVDAFEAGGGVRHDLRSSHLTNTSRYLAHHLGLVKEWLRAELDAEEASGEERSGTPAAGDARRAVEALVGSAGAEPPADPASSPRALEQALAAMVRAARLGDRPRPTLARHGELPEDLLGFTATVSASPQDQQQAAWRELGLGEPGPHHLRLWTVHVREGHGPSWEDVLQDALAVALGEQRRKPPELIGALLEAREVEAVLAIGDWPGYSDEACRALVERAAGMASRKARLETELYELDAVHDRLRHLHLTPSEADELRRADGCLFDGLAASTRYELEAGERHARDARALLDRVSSTAVARTEAQDSRTREIRDWLVAAGCQPPDQGAEGLERLRREVLEGSKPRRRHILRLEQLEQAEAPDVFRSAVRDLRRQLDVPGRWPSEQNSANADTYLELLQELSSLWWRTLPALTPEDAAFQRVHAIAEAVAGALPAEVGALLEGKGPEAAPCLGLLVERGSGVIAEYYAMLVRARIVEARLPDPVPAPPAPLVVMEPAASPPPAPKAAAAAPAPPAGPAPGPADESEPRAADHAPVRRRLIDQLAAELGLAAGQPGGGQDVEAAYQAFANGDRAGCASAAARAFGWAQQVNNSDFGDEMVTLAAWASREATLERRREALALLASLNEKAQRRARLDEQRFAAEWIAAWGLPAGEVAEAALLGHLGGLARAPASAPEREQLARLLRATDPARMARYLWNTLTGKGGVQKARKALLRILYDFEYVEALTGLLEDEEQRKYVRPFVALARRTAAEASPRLHAALQLSLKTLQQRLDTRPFKDFAEELVRDLGVTKARVQLRLVGELERAGQDGYRVLISVEPDEADPPIQLRLTLVEQDFLAVGEALRDVLAGAPLLLENREVEFQVRPLAGVNSAVISLKAEGESASGQRIEEEARFQVQLSGSEPFHPLGADELLEIYEGCKGKPVAARAFIGREEELRVLEHALVRGTPGAAILYGARRLGKTSLLDEMRQRYCVTRRGDGSRTLFLVVGVDSFEFGAAVQQSGRTFPEVFFKLITDSVYADSKNQPFRDLLSRAGVGPRDLAMAAKLPPEFAGMSFLAQLREYLGALERLAAGKVGQIVLVFDEFDKLLESYRKGLQPEVNEIVNQLRKAATEEHLGMVLAGSDLMRRILGDYRSALFGSTVEVELSCFDRDEVKQDALRIVVPDRIRTYREFTPAVVELIVAVTGGHPLYMQLVAAAAAYVSDRRTISPGTVTRAIQDLMRDKILAGRISHPKNLVTQPLQSLGLLDSQADEALGRLLLIRLAYHSSLEKPWLQWSRLAGDEELLALRPEEAWIRLRDQLREARVLVQNAKKQWSFRFPIIGEALRVGWERDFETVRARLVRETTA